MNEMVEREFGLPSLACLWIKGRGAHCLEESPHVALRGLRVCQDIAALLRVYSGDTVSVGRGQDSRSRLRDL